MLPNVFAFWLQYNPANKNLVFKKSGCLWFLININIGA